MCLGDLVWKYDNFFFLCEHGQHKRGIQQRIPHNLFIYRSTFRISFDSTESTEKELLVDIDVCKPWCVFVCSRGMFFSILDLILLELYSLRCAGIQRKNTQNDEEQKKKFLYKRTTRYYFCLYTCVKGNFMMVAKGAYESRVLNTFSRSSIHIQTMFNAKNNERHKNTNWQSIAYADIHFL